MNCMLVTSTGGTVGPLVLKMIREALPAHVRIVAADASTDVSYLGGIARAARLPLASAPDYATAVRKLIAEEKVDVVLPLSEEECLAIAHMEKNETLGANYLGMAEETLRVITDKLRCADVLSAAGIDVPRSKALKGIGDFESTLAELGYPDRPVVLKPISARGSRGFRVISAQTDRLEEFARKGGPIFMDAEQATAIFEGCEHALRDFFLMEFLPGGSASVDLVAWRGQPLGIFPHFRLGYEWGFVDHARIDRSPLIEEYCESVINVLGMHGMCNIEVGFRENGTISLIEVNGRTSATVAQNMLVGANSLEIFLRAAEGKAERFEFNTTVNYRTYTEYRSLK